MKAILVALVLLLVPVTARAQPCPDPPAQCLVQPGMSYTVTFDSVVPTDPLITGYRIKLDGVAVGADVLICLSCSIAVVLAAAPLGDHTLQAAALWSGGESLSAPYTFTVGTTTPPPATVTLGLTTPGGAQDSNASNFLDGSKVVLSVAAQLVSISVYVGPIDALVANQQFQLAIYTNGAGRPATRIASSSTGQLVANAWNTLPIAVALQPGIYWLVYNTNGRSDTVNNLWFNAGPVGQSAYSTAFWTFGTWPAIFPASTVTDFTFSIYATVDTGAQLLRLTPTNVKLIK
jgi:hypothetical protein